MMNADKEFSSFLTSFLPDLIQSTTLLNKAVWMLETTGAQDAADIKQALDTKVRFLLQDPTIYQNLIAWEGKIQDPLLQRQHCVLLRQCKQFHAPKDLLASIVQKETQLLMTYANFRPSIEGIPLSENDIKEILSKETDIPKRKQAWESAKEIGNVLAPHILSLVDMRNQMAQGLGYSDYFHMQLHLQEIDPTWLFSLLTSYYEGSQNAYTTLITHVNQHLAKKLSLPVEDIGPFAWSDPFCQEDPIDTKELDSLVANVHLINFTTSLYAEMGIDITPILNRSDLFERAGKNQHAFCIHIDREGDVRTLNNLQPTLKWLETLLHELGHAVYELGFAADTPWLLKEPPHMIPTEAMALIAGRQAYRSYVLSRLPLSPNQKPLISSAEMSLVRRQMIFGRWVLVMTYFEKELYANPKQDLQKLWWHLVQTYQGIAPPQGRHHHHDWAAKYHIGLAPVYYYSYLLGEMMASSLEKMLLQKTGSPSIFTPQAKKLLETRLFAPANRMSCAALAIHATGHPLSIDAWMQQYAKLLE